jgi:type 2 lantibiotic biosynthesis protein LanM
MLRDALDRDRFLDRLWVGVPSRGWLARLIPAEREDLMNGDIPLFTARPGSRDLWTSTGRRISGVFAETGMHCSVEKIRSLGEDDLTRQLSYIGASLALRETVADRGPGKLFASDVAEPVGGATLQSQACTIGDKLLQTAHRGKSGASWIGLEWINQKQWTLSPLGPSLYDGLAGVILFLAYLGAPCGDSYTLLAEEALLSLRRQIAEQRSLFRVIGAFSGWGGVIYLLTHLGSIWKRPDLLSEAEEIVHMLPPLIGQDQDLDLLTGAAGCLCGLCVLYEVTGSDLALSTAIQCGKHLCAKAEHVEGGLAWSTRVSNGRPLTGLSHGAAGIAFALLRLAEYSDEVQFSETAEGALEYERATFSSREQNWPDFRDLPLTEGDTSDAKCMTAWCHGAPGIGLGRLATLPQLKNSLVREEIDIAIATTIRSGFGKNHSLCHGDLGNLELLLQSSNLSGEERLRRDLDRFTAAISADIANRGWVCGTPRCIESPSLMTGLSGIGYQLLRLAHPGKIPSVLTLQAPMRAQGQASGYCRKLTEAATR